MQLLEPLELRQHLSATLIDGLLRVTGTNTADSISIISITLHAHQYRVTVNGVTQNFAAPKVHLLKIRSFAGDDTVQLAGRIPIRTAIYADAGNDSISGSDGREFIVGGAGDDQISGNAGQDTLYGSAGDDTLHGGADDDFISGDNGDDSLLGDAGQDILTGGRGADYLNGGLHSVWLTGDDGNDTLFDHSGNDTLFGMDGNDSLDTADGHAHDELHGGLGKDHIRRDKGDALNPAPPQETDQFPFDFPTFDDNPSS